MGNFEQTQLSDHNGSHAASASRSSQLDPKALDDRGQAHTKPRRAVFPYHRAMPPTIPSSGSRRSRATGTRWLVALALIIGAEELLETSVMAAALRDEVARREAA